MPASLHLSPASRAPSAGARRFAPFDWMRGLVMVLMAVDHSSEQFNAGRLFTDSTLFYQPGAPLPVAQFLTRWVTHLCAPTFVFLAGASMALQVDRRAASGESAGSIDRYLALRGLVIMAFEVWVSFFWMPPGRFLFQVLYAIGASFVFMVPLRRLPVPLLVALAAAILVAGEGLDRALGWGPAPVTSLLATLLLVPGRRGPLFVAYPALPWLSFMLLGWAFGSLLVRGPDPRKTARVLGVTGASLLALYAGVRAGNGYGNMGLLRESGALVQWLHVSKYPPSLSFASLELGIATLMLAALTMAAEHVPVRPSGPLTVLGRTPMFFYLLHIPLLALIARVLGVGHTMGLGGTYFFAAVVVAALYPLCRAYGRFKAARRSGWTRYV